MGNGVTLRFQAIRAVARRLLYRESITAPTTQETPMSTKNEFEAIDPTALETVAGGAARVSGGGSSNDQLTAMLTQITSSIKDLAASKNTGTDPMTMMLMMMMMGGMGGGGGGGGYAAAPFGAAGPPVINVDTGVSGGGGGGCGGRGKKGW